MANNRMYLRCKACKVAFPIAKTLANGYYTSGNMEPALNVFLDDHTPCSIADENCFEVCYETGEPELKAGEIP